MRLFATLFFLLFLFGNALCQLSIEQELHHYAVEDLENYQETISVIGQNRSNSDESLGFLVNEDAELLNYQLYERKGSKWKPSKLKREITISTIDRSSFFSGTRYYYFPIPSGMEFKLEFSTKEKHTVFLTKFYSAGWFDAEWVKYSFELPDNLMLSSRSVDSYAGAFQISDEIYGSEPSMPYLVHPKDVEPIAYFSKWFEDRIDPQLEIDPSLIPEELTIISERGNRLELAKACFQFVQQKIKYIDIENGINAIIPRQCEKVLKNGLGDCKDMATLLTALYRHFGFEAYSAISRTNDKAGVLNFPSIGLANHTICTLRFEDEWYFLDATEDACLFGDASIQTLGSEVFLVGYDGDPFLDVDENPRSKSLAELNYVLNEDMALTLEMKTFGKMNHFLYHTKLKENDPSEVIKSVLEQISGVQWEISKVSIVDSMSIVTASAKMNSSMYSKMGSKNLYNLKFLPNPRLMTALFQNSSYPIFKGEVIMNLDFGGEVRSDFSGRGTKELEIIQPEQELVINCTLEKFDDAESFKRSELIKAWNTLIKQPLLIGYED
ncbi:MAG: transglutaminase domain-containing protein [Crocinitomicaceae bacterium]|nr:transglutaminase domain-containing protein [Crocinitomicaceae bacterium]